MVIVFDTCVIMDHLVCRKPFYEYSRKLLEISGNHRFNGVISAKSAADIHYLLKKYLHDEGEVRKRMNILMTFVGIVSTDAFDVHAALTSNIVDFEDGILSQTASRIGADYIITRNVKDFKYSRVPAILPEDFLKLLPDYSIQ